MAGGSCFVSYLDQKSPRTFAECGWEDKLNIPTHSLSVILAISKFTTRKYLFEENTFCCLSSFVFCVEEEKEDGG